MRSSRSQFDLHENLCPRTDTVRARLCLAAGLLAAMLCGCESSDRGTMANSYYLNSYENLRELGRVTLVELDNMSNYPAISADMTRALFLELQKKQVFSVATVAREDPAWRPLQDNLDSLQAMQALLQIREQFKGNGLLVGTITEYRPYPRLAIGLRLKLIDLTNGQVLWGVEQVWDSTDRNVQKRVQAYSRKELRSGSSPLPEQLVGVSSLEFAKFAAYEVAQTLDGKKK
jgi:hypothetical protein